MPDIFNKVSVVIPVYNNGDIIDQHLDSLSPILSRFGQIIVVDSYSDDGTFEKIQDYFAGRNALIYQRPRGLYQSWNCAISKVNRPYTYISTVGDIPCLGELETFFDLVDESQVEVGISPPDVYRANDSNFKNEKTVWPISEIITLFSIKESLILDYQEVLMLNNYCIAKFGSSSLSGSFASNLFCTDLLQSEPFSYEFSGAGDFVWWAKVCGRCRLLVYPRNVAKFLEHEKTYTTLSNAEIEEMLDLGLSFNSASQILRECRLKLLESKGKLRMAKRTYGFLRYIFPQVHSERMTKKRCREDIREYYLRLEKGLSDMLREKPTPK